MFVEDILNLGMEVSRSEPERESLNTQLAPVCLPPRTVCKAWGLLTELRTRGTLPNKLGDFVRYGGLDMKMRASLRRFYKIPSRSCYSAGLRSNRAFRPLRQQLEHRQYASPAKAIDSSLPTRATSGPASKGPTPSRAGGPTFGSQRFEIVNWSRGSSAIEIIYNDHLHTPGAGDTYSKFPNFWLRDHCLCPECTHEHTKQRRIDTSAIDLDIKISALEPSPEGLTIYWDTPLHTSYFAWSWLHAHRPFRSIAVRKRKLSKDLPEHPAVDYDSIIVPTNDGLLAYLEQINEYGFCFTPGTPVTTEATEALLNRISFIRRTHYGAFWDFTSVANPVDTAYTNLGLPAHTDTTYFTDPCGLQLFHMLSHTNGSGGESTFVDGFAAATYLYSKHKDHYATLSDVPIVSHASGSATAGLIDNTALQRGYPVFNHLDSWQVLQGPRGPERPARVMKELHAYAPSRLVQIRWNNDDRSPLTRFGSAELMRAWYEAVRVWAEILKMPEFEITMQLQPGNPVIFDNWRVLHGRRPFTGERRMCGGYIGMDDYRARLQGLRAAKKMEAFSEMEGEGDGEGLGDEEDLMRAS